MVKHSIVIPVYNEAQGLPVLFERVKALINRIETNSSIKSNEKCEVILVNDGSRDGSREALDAIHAKDPRFLVLHFSRNFGHQAAITAGIDWATGDTVSVMDADLQDPPEVIEEMITKWREGYEVVYATRRHREGETQFKLWTAKIFYRLIRRITNVEIPLDTGDFRLMDRRAVDALKSLPEHNRFIRGLVSWIGFKQIGVPYDRASREFGQTHYPFLKMLKFALDGVTSFSMFPLQIATYIGFFSAFLAFIGIVWALIAHFFYSSTVVQGWTSIMLVVLFLGGVQLLALGIIGEYLGRTYDETRGRPNYLIDKALGFIKNEPANH